jgi:hypothetical protein
MTTELEIWLKQATRHLSSNSAAQVRTEIQEHYESAREVSILGGATADEADRLAVAALGDTRAANRQYRKVLLTSSEARILRDCNWEARAVCSRAWLKWLLLGMPVAVILAAAVCFLAGEIDVSRVLVACGVGTGVMFVAPFLPIYTVSRGRVFRVVKCVAMTAALGFAFGPDALKYSWLLASSLWPLFWIEWTRISIRRKLPVAEWPKQLYL